MKRILTGVAMAVLVTAPGLPAFTWVHRPAMPPVSINAWAFVTTTDSYVQVLDMRDNMTPYGAIHGISLDGIQGFDIVYNPVTNQVVTCGGQALQVIDPVGLAAGPAFTVGGGSYITQFLKMTPDHLTYIAGATDGSQTILYEVDAVTFNIRSQITLPIVSRSASDICFKPGASQGGVGTNQVYVAYSGLTFLHKVDLGTGLDMTSPTVTQVSFGTDMPFRVDVNRAGTKVFVTGEFATLAPRVLDPVSGTHSPISGFTGDGLADIIVRPQGDVGYFGDSTGLGTFNAGTDAYIPGSPPVPPYMNHFSISSDGRILAAGGGSRLSFFDLSTPTSPASLGSVSGVSMFREVAFAPAQPPVIERLATTAADAFPIMVRMEGRNFSAAGPPRMSIAGYPVTINQVTPTSVEGSYNPSMLSPGRYSVTYQNQLGVTATQADLAYGFTVTDTTPYFGQTGVPAGSVQADYRLRSFPGLIPAGAGRTALIAAFGPYNPTQWRMFMWDRRQQQYVEFDQLPTGPLTADWAGEGFFLISRNPGLVTAPGFTASPEATPPPLAVPLAPGWNIVGSPWDANLMDWTDSSYVNAQLNSDGTGEPQAPSALSISDLIEWTPTGYMATTTMVPGLGYWVHNPQPTTVWLFMSPEPDGGGEPGSFFTMPSSRPLGPGDPVPPMPPGYGTSGSRAGCGMGMTGGGGPILVVLAAALLLAAGVRLLRRA